MKELFYVRGIKLSRKAFLILAVVVLLLLALLTYLLFTHSTAPWWTYLTFPLLYVVSLFYFLKRTEYYFIDIDRKVLMAGSNLTGKEEIFSPLLSLSEVTYLPHTKEVKIVSGRGTNYLKLKNGKAFVDALEAVFEQIMPDDEQDA